MLIATFAEAAMLHTLNEKLDAVHILEVIRSQSFTSTITLAIVFFFVLGPFSLFFLCCDCVKET